MVDNNRNDLKEIFESIKQQQNSMRSILSDVSKQFKEFREQISVSLKPLVEYQNHFHELAERARKSYSDLINDGPELLSMLSNFGWFITYDSVPRQLYEISDLLRGNNEHELEIYMMDMIKNEINYIVRNLDDNFPDRRVIFDSAFKAHNTQNYYSSIPLFLAQADGICIEYFYTKLYAVKRKTGKTVISKEVEKVKDEFLRVFLEPIIRVNILNVSKEDRHKFEGSLNRHEILHGISKDYGTETNSYKSISLLNFVNSVLYPLASNRGAKST